ncbi:uncharacterized protein LOC143027129 [Oratosquilla oratoria]|uniref:uncharacterized protein LOC143027129 n=1 Tax=Oratosquilla oratoria TaxID=337810 RepID=UPI003F75D4E6
MKTQAFFSVFSILLLYHSLFPGEVWCVVVQKIEVPQPAIVGKVARLRCVWSAGSGSPLYSLRWRKNGTEFFAVTTKPRVKVVHSVSGVHVQVGVSNEYGVSLFNVSKETAGKYSCEAMSDEPFFHQSTMSAALEVVDLPSFGPVWSHMRSIYRVDQLLQPKCSVYESMPTAYISFHISGSVVKTESSWMRVFHHPSTKSGHVYNSSSSLSVRLTMDILMQLYPDNNLLARLKQDMENLKHYQSLISPSMMYLFTPGGTSSVQDSTVWPLNIYSANHSTALKRHFGIQSLLLPLNITCHVDVGGIPFCASMKTHVLVRPLLHRETPEVIIHPKNSTSRPVGMQVLVSVFFLFTMAMEVMS